MEFDPALVDKLLSLLQHADSSDLRSHTARALSWLGDSRAVDPLISTLKDEDPDVRWCAAFALGDLGDNRAVEPLIAMLKDTSPNVRESAAHALGKIEDDRSIEPLIQALRDENGRVQYTVALMMKEPRDERLIEPLVALLADHTLLANNPAKDALIAFGKAAVPALMVALTNPEIGKQYQKDDYSILGSGEVVYNAAKVLGEIGDIRPLPVLLWMVENDREETHIGKVRDAAAEAIKKIQERHQVAAPLIAVLRSEDSTMRTAAAFALGLLGDRRAVEPLIAAMQDENERIRWSAADLLDRIRDQRAIVPLIAALKDDQVLLSAADALHKFGELAIVPLIAALKDESPDVRAQAVRILGSLRPSSLACSSRGM